MPIRALRRRWSGRPWIAAAALLGLLAVALGATVALVVQRWEAAAGGASAGEAGAGGSNREALLTATLYYVTEDGRALTRQETFVPLEADPLARARAVVEQQLTPPPSPLLSPFPTGTSLRAIYLADDGNAFVDLSEDVTTGHSRGSLDELFTVYALVNALTVSVPEIVAVQIMVEGREVDTLAGHVDLRQPLAPSLVWVLDDEDLESPDGPDAVDPAGEPLGDEAGGDLGPEGDDRT